MNPEWYNPVRYVKISKIDISYEGGIPVAGLSMVASHAAGKGGEPDIVFSTLKRANDAIAKYGLDNVVNATIGAIFDEQERFVSLSTVEKYYRQLPAEDLMNYAPIAGLPEYLQAVIDYIFQGYQPEGAYVGAVATPGGSGAVRHIFYNYLEEGQKVLIPDWFWGPYRTVVEEHKRGFETYQMFDQDNNFLLSSVRGKSRELLQKQDNLVVVFNTPGHNPTGYSVSYNEWAELLDFYRECAKDQKKKITIFLDIAYIDYAGSVEETRGFMKLFKDLPANILIAFAFSMSKSFTMYGMRSGAVVGLSSYPEIIEEFKNANSFSSRAVWSNNTRGPQRLLADLMAKPELKAAIDQERKAYYDLIVKRADIFLQEAAEVGLKTLPYRGGFFISIPTANSLEIAAKLEQENLFMVPLAKGLRLAVCSVPAHKMPGVAAKIKAALDS